MRRIEWGEKSMGGRLLERLVESCSPALPFAYGWEVSELDDGTLVVGLRTYRGNGVIKHWQNAVEVRVRESSGEGLARPGSALEGLVSEGVSLELSKAMLERLLQRMVEFHADWRIRL